MSDGLVDGDGRFDEECYLQKLQLQEKGEKGDLELSGRGKQAI